MSSQPEEIDPLIVEVQTDEIIELVNTKLSLKFNLARVSRQFQTLTKEHEELGQQLENLSIQLEKANDVIRDRDNTIREGQQSNDRLIEDRHRLVQENREQAQRISELTRVDEEPVEFKDPQDGPLTDSV